MLYFTSWLALAVGVLATGVFGLNSATYQTRQLITGKFSCANKDPESGHPWWTVRCGWILLKICGPVFMSAQLLSPVFESHFALLPAVRCKRKRNLIPTGGHFSQRYRLVLIFFLCWTVYRFIVSIGLQSSGLHFFESSFTIWTLNKTRQP